MKNRTLRIGLIVAILTLVTSCFMGSTFAKYVTNDTAEDTARVAKWGVTVEFTKDQTNNQLAKLYAADNGSAGVTNSVNVDTSISDSKLVAPGTKGVIFAAAVAGKPEVAVNVKAVFNAEFTGWAIDGLAWYCPIKFAASRTVIGGTTEEKTFYGMDYADATALVAAIEGWFSSEANYDPNTTIDCSYSINWEWIFEGTDGKQTDERDTALASLATMPSFTFNYTIGVTQID